MTAELINQGAYGCLYHPGIACNGKTMKDAKYATKLVIQDAVAENEVEVGKIVMKILNYAVNFVPVVETCRVQLGKVKRNNPLALRGCDIVAEAGTSKKKFMLMKMPYIDSLYFYDYIRTMRENKKKIISCIFDTYIYITESIGRLVEHDVVHYDLKLENILINLKTDTPIIIDFGLSIPIMAMERDDFWTTYFYKYAPQYYVWPLEAHVINFLCNKSESGALTHDELVSICETFVNANQALRIFSKGFRARYLKACIEQWESLTGVARAQACHTLIKGWATWDNYSLSVAYLQILEFISSEGFSNNYLIIQYVELLLTNVHPDPERRKTVGETKRLFTDLFYMNKNVDTYDTLVQNFNVDMFVKTVETASQLSHSSSFAKNN
jgi:serine/threonine protein kinase